VKEKIPWGNFKGSLKKKGNAKKIVLNVNTVSFEKKQRKETVLEAIFLRAWRGKFLARKKYFGLQVALELGMLRKRLKKLIL